MKTTKHLAFLIAAIYSLWGCSSTAPHENQPFKEIADISELAGVYENKGDGGGGQRSIFLSKILWPKDGQLEHEEVKLIKVEKVSDQALLVQGIGQELVRKKSMFVLGRDFELTAGSIRLHSEAGIAGLKSGEPMVGLYAGGSKIGLDAQGHGKFQSSGTAAGLVFLVVPMAVSGSQEVRFRRVE